MSFHYANVPAADRLPAALSGALSAYNKAADTLAGVQFDHAQATSQAAIEAADALDADLMRACLAKQKDPATVGRPNATALRVKVIALESAKDVAMRDAYDRSLELAQALGEHRDAVVEAARREVTATATTYAEAVAGLVDARRAYHDAVGLLKWAYSVDGQTVPNHGAVDDGPPLSDGAFATIDGGRLHAMLANDAATHEKAERDEAARVVMATRNANAEAANRADFRAAVVVTH